MIDWRSISYQAFEEGSSSRKMSYIYQKKSKILNTGKKGLFWDDLFEKEDICYYLRILLLMMIG